MLLITHPLDARNASILKQMYRLRARQFRDRRGWSVLVENDEERDVFDELNPLYLCVIDEDSQLLASLRLLPTMGPHMLSDVFADVMGGRPFVRSPKVWESSRFCVDTDLCRRFSEDGVNEVTRSILYALFDLARNHELEGIVSVYDLYVERILKRSGCDIQRLGPVVDYDGLKTAGGLFQVTKAVVDRLNTCATVRRLACAA